MSTKKLCDLDSDVIFSRSRVLKIERCEDGARVLLDETPFFPEGGGQTSDVGKINESVVLNVLEDENNDCWHLLDDPKDIKPGDMVDCLVDMKKRTIDMQNHSGEHVFCGVAHTMFGCENVGFNLGKEFVTVDLDKSLSDEVIFTIEKKANEIIREDKKINVFFANDEQRNTLNYRSKKEIKGALRLVEIADTDLCACCAPHVKSTGKIGQLVVLSTEKHRGTSRVKILCGERATEYTRRILSQNQRTANLLCTKDEDTFFSVSALKNKNHDLKYKLKATQKELFLSRAKKAEKRDVFFEFLDFGDMELVRECAMLFSKKAEKFAVCVCESGEFALLSDTGFDLNAVLLRLKEKFSLKGGGRDNLMSGKITAKKEELQAFFEENEF